MTIQQINIGTTPNDNTGDDPRTVGQKVNANFTDAANAASKLVGIGANQIPDSNQGFHIGNLNPNVFGGTGVSTHIATGVAASSSAGVFYLPISSISHPTSITQVSSFDVVNAALTANYAPGINVVFSGISSNKLCVVTFTGGSSMTAGQDIFLRQRTITSKITVN